MTRMMIGMAFDFEKPKKDHRLERAINTANKRLASGPKQFSARAEFVVFVPSPNHLHNVTYKQSCQQDESYCREPPIPPQIHDNLAKRTTEWEPGALVHMLIAKTTYALCAMLQLLTSLKAFSLTYQGH
jgi:hypothetical protein